MELVSSYTSLWAVWIAMFVAVEGSALFRKEKGDTLSEHVWKWIGKRGYEKPSGYKWRRGALGLFLAWLIAHFFFGV